MTTKLDKFWQDAAGTYRPGKDGPWRCVLFLSPINWRFPQLEFDEGELKKLKEKSLAQIKRKGDIMVVRTLTGTNDEPPYDPVFAELCEMVNNREVDCVAVPNIFHFAGNSYYAYHLVRDVYDLVGVRFLDAAWRFDSMSCDAEQYLERVKAHVRKRKKPNVSTGGKLKEV